MSRWQDESENEKALKRNARERRSKEREEEKRREKKREVEGRNVDNAWGERSSVQWNKPEREERREKDALVSPSKREKIRQAKRGARVQGVG